MAFEPMHLAHETPGIRGRMVFGLVVGFVVFVGLLMALLAVFFRWETGGTQTRAQYRTFPPPRLQPNPNEDYERLKDSQRRELSSTYWVDRSRGILHLSIDRAMTYVASQGDSGFDPPGLLPNQTAPKAAADGAPRARPHIVPAPYGRHP